MSKLPENNEPHELVYDKASNDLVSELRKNSGSDIEVFASLRDELRRVARSMMRWERPNHTLQPTALVNEAFIKLFKGRLPDDFGENKSRTMRVIAHAMEQILNDHADAYRANKRGGAEKRRIPVDEHQAHEWNEDESQGLLDTALVVKPVRFEVVLGVRNGLRRLRQISPREAQVLQLHFYGGLTQQEIAASLGVSVETVKLDERKARAFLKVYLETKSA
jgi:RNA polymerase sigma-70 factor (ECF subfamily)